MRYDQQNTEEERPSRYVTREELDDELRPLWKEVVVHSWLVGLLLFLVVGRYLGWW